MSTGRILEDEFGSYADEVLNAGWMPHPEATAQPMVQAGLQTVAEAEAIDTDAYMKRLYASQE